MPAAELQIGGGALRSPKDERDLHLAFLASAPEPIVWRTERLGRPRPPLTNQRSADCCVGEGSSTAHWTISGVRWSVRSVFAYIALEWGAGLRDGPMRIVHFGQQPYTEAADPEPKTMQNMRLKEGLDPVSAARHKALKMFSTNGRDINQVAQAIRDWRHCIFGLDVSNEGWKDKTYPRPPKYEEGSAGHCITGFDYHICSDGQKCIIAQSSWAQGTHMEHHIRENYFKSLSMFGEAYVLVPRSNMVKRYIVQKGGKLGVLVSVDGDGIFTDTVFWAKSEGHLQQLKAQYEVPETAPRLVYPA